MTSVPRREVRTDRRIIEEEGRAHFAEQGFDDPHRFAAFLHTLRWHCVTATDANLFQAPFRAGIRIDAYQMEPLRKALRLPRVNRFIASDTGLGKTIEAGLIAHELLLCRKAKTIMVAAPPSVLEQWKGELEDRFGLVREILDRTYLARMRRERGFGVNPWMTYSRAAGRGVGRAGDAQAARAGRAGGARPGRNAAPAATRFKHCVSSRSASCNSGRRRIEWPHTNVWRSVADRLPSIS